MRCHSKRRLAAAAFVLAVAVGGVASSASGGSKAPASPATVKSGGDKASFTGGIDGRFVVRQGEVFYKATLYNVRYSEGPVILAGDSAGTLEFGVDDVLIVKVVRPDGTTATFSNDFSSNCSGGITPLPPTDISSKFEAGMNKVLVTLKDKCGFIEGSSALWLLP
jgi:hypothetical protein